MEEGAHANAVGRSRGDPTTKLHALVDGLGQRGDASVAGDLVGLLPASAVLAADRAYDSDALRHLLIARGTTPVIPKGPCRKNLHPFDRTAYNRRNLLERAICRIKDLRRVAIRYDKLAATYAGAISLAAIVK